VRTDSMLIYMLDVLLNQTPKLWSNTNRSKQTWPKARLIIIALM